MTGVEAKILMMTGKSFKEILSKLFDEGKTTRQIGHELSISDGSVRRYAKTYGIVPDYKLTKNQNWGWYGISKKN